MTETFMIELAGIYICKGKPVILDVLLLGQYQSGVKAQDLSEDGVIASEYLAKCGLVKCSDAVYTLTDEGVRRHEKMIGDLFNSSHEPLKNDRTSEYPYGERTPHIPFNLKPYEITIESIEDIKRVKERIIPKLDFREEINTTPLKLENIPKLKNIIDEPYEIVGSDGIPREPVKRDRIIDEPKLIINFLKSPEEIRNPIGTIYFNEPMINLKPPAPEVGSDASKNDDGSAKDKAKKN